MPSSVLQTLIPPDPSFRDHETIQEQIRTACSESGGLASFHELGKSEEGRLLYAVRMGRGERAVSLIAGNHADEPVGPETLRTFILKGLERREELSELFGRFQFFVVPHTNPDGEARNRAWMERWPDVKAYVTQAVREEPGRDLEFGFPDMRPENRIVSDFLSDHAPFSLHMSLHGMGFSEGAMLLIERHWTFRTQELRDRFVQSARDAGLRLHDHNRKGEKGFFYIEPGFTTTPEGEAMRTYFRAQGDDAMARRFRDSSMEYVRSLGGDPLCLVTELPLFVLGKTSDGTPGRPAAYLALKERLAEVRRHFDRGNDAAAKGILDAFDVRPLAPRTAMRLQMEALRAGLDVVLDGASAA